MLEESATDKEEVNSDHDLLDNIQWNELIKCQVTSINKSVIQMKFFCYS